MISFLLFLVLSVFACTSVDNWNALTLNAIRVNATAPPIASRVLAIVNIAIYDAVASISKENVPYKYSISTTAPPSAIDAAVIAAASTALIYLFPNQQITLAANYTAGIAALNVAAEAVAAGVSIGTQVAQAVIADRQSDGTQVPVAYLGSNAPGTWRPSPPAFLPAETPEYGTQRPWCMTSFSMLRPPAPPDYATAVAIADHNQIFHLGALNSTVRSDEETRIANFWYDPANSDTPPGHWALEASSLTCAMNFSVAATARVFALMTMALADAAIMAWDAKYTYGQWRPITAIRFATNATALLHDPNWLPLLNTPNWPDYVSDRSAFGGAASQVLARIFGADLPIIVQASDFNMSRSYASFASAAFEQGQSRVYAGAHVNTSVMMGLYYGQLVGNWTYNHCLQLSHVTPSSVTTVAVVTATASSLLPSLSAAISVMAAMQLC